MKLPKNHAARLAAIEDMKARHTNELQEFDQARNEARGRIYSAQLEAVASAESDAESARKMLAAALLEDLERGLYPLCVQFGDAPRSTAQKISDLWRELDARALEELAAPLAYHHLGLAMLATRGGDIVRAGHSAFWDNGVREVCGLAIETIKTTDGTAIVESRLRALEIAIDIACRLPLHQDAAALEARKRSATQGDLAIAMATPTSEGMPGFLKGDPNRFRTNTTRPANLR